MCSITHVFPDDFEITSVRIFGSTPNPSAIRNASLTATAATPAIRLLQSFATSPEPTGPTWMMLAPIAARHGRVDESHAALAGGVGHPSRHARIDRGHVDAETTGDGALEDAARTEVRRLHV